MASPHSLPAISSAAAFRLPRMSMDQSAPTTSSTAMCSPLLQLPATLLTVVLSYLPLPIKFAALPRVGRSFPRLLAPAFRDDHLELPVDCLAWLSAQPRIASQLAQLPSLHLTHRDAHSLRNHFGAFASTVPKSFATVELFSSLRQLFLSCASPLVQVFAKTAPQLPLLHTFGYADDKLRVKARSPTLIIGDLSRWLSELPSLQHLTLDACMASHALGFLFSLPLLTLDLQHSRMFSSTAATRHSTQSTALFADYTCHPISY